MVHAETVLTSIASAIRESGLMPPEITYSIVELDMQGEHSGTSLPVVELTRSNVERDRSRNTNKVADVLNENDNKIGYVYEDWYSMDVQCDVLTAAGDGHDSRDLVHTIDQSLNEYDSHRMGHPLPDPDGGLLSDVSSLYVDGLSPANDLSLSPALRRERLRLGCSFEHRFSTVDVVGEAEPITGVQTPTDGDINATSSEQIELDTSDR